MQPLVALTLTPGHHCWYLKAAHAVVRQRIWFKGRASGSEAALGQRSDPDCKALWLFRMANTLQPLAR